MENVDGLVSCVKLRVCKLVGYGGKVGGSGLKRVLKLELDDFGNDGCLDLDLDFGMFCRIKNLRLGQGVEGVDVTKCLRLRKLALFRSVVCGIEKMNWLRSLILFGFFKDLRWLEGCTWLENLELNRCRSTVCVGGLVNLRTLRVIKCVYVNYVGIEKCRELGNLMLDIYVWESRKYDFLAECVRLRALTINFLPCNDVLGRCGELMRLDLGMGMGFRDCRDVGGLSVLVKCEKLEVLKLGNCYGTCVDELIGCERLRELDVSGIDCVVDIGKLIRGCPRLEVVRAVGCSNLVNFRSSRVSVVRF